MASVVVFFFFLNKASVVIMSRNKDGVGATDGHNNHMPSLKNHLECFKCLINM